jgi:anti-sigma regulatory factor (Ser/Thr protein kinase)
MRARRLLLVAVSVLVVGVVVAVLVVVTAAAVPLVLALGVTVLALVAGGAVRPRRRAGWRRGRPAPGPAGVARDDPGADGRGAASPLRWSTRWESEPPVHAVPDTRDRVTLVLAEWGLADEAVEPTLMVVTELLSNTIDHARGPVALSVGLSAAGVVHVKVHDASPEPPQMRPPDPARIRGRGVYLVDALSLRWGWTPEPPGKVVWADVPTEWPT